MPLPATLSSFVYFVIPGRKPFGRVGVHDVPPSKVALTAQPSLKFQSFAPVIMFSGFFGLIAIGVSFWDVWSRLTSTTGVTAIFAGVAAVALQAVDPSTTSAASASRTFLKMLPSP